MIPGNPAEEPVSVVLSLGSNMGEREWNVLSGASAVEGLNGISCCELSSLYLSEPVGAGFSSKFVNAVMTLRTTMAPIRLLLALQRIEREAGRGDERGGDRTLDIDIVIFGEERIDSAELTVPHPEFRRRLFVLLPLSELSPSMKLPPDGESASHAARSLVAGQRVDLISSRKIAKRGSGGRLDIDL